jgi:hypothetical protein
MVLLRSVIVSEKSPKSLGQGRPPKGIRRDTKAKSLTTVTHLEAIVVQRWIRLNAALKSTFWR